MELLATDTYIINLIDLEDGSISSIFELKTAGAFQNGTIVWTVSRVQPFFPFHFQQLRLQLKGWLMGCGIDISDHDMTVLLEAYHKALPVVPKSDPADDSDEPPPTPPTFNMN